MVVSLKLKKLTEGQQKRWSLHRYMIWRSPAFFMKIRPSGMLPLANAVRVMLM